MNNKRFLILLLFHLVLVIPAIISFIDSSNQVNCDQLSTGFVLEPLYSDSETPQQQPQPPQSNKRAINTSASSNSVVSSDSLSSGAQDEDRKSDDANTRVITDDSADGETNTDSKKTSNYNSDAVPRKNQSAAQQPSSSDPTVQKRSSSPPNHPKAISSSNQSRDTNANARRLEEDGESQLVPNRNPASATRSRTTTTTRSPHYDDGKHDEQPPKTEERLLITVTSGQDDDDSYGESYSGKPAKATGSVTSLDDVSAVSNQNHKRKPSSITISIQDSNVNKQNPGSGTSSLILRPGSDGQSIVIATMNANSKPSRPINNPSPVYDNGNSGGGYPSSSSSGYQEPINTGLQSIIQQHSTTRRPSVNEDYNTNSRPISSGSVQRPNSVIGSGNNYDINDSRPVTSARPVIRPPVNDNNSGPENDDYNTNSGGSSFDGEDQYHDTSNNNNNNNQYSNEKPKYPLNEKNCGIRHETRIVGGDVAQPDDFLWMAAVIKSMPRESEQKPFCGGSLITRRHILTAAHCLEGLAPRDVLVRLGSYDFDDSTASSLSADYAIDQFRVPSHYSKKTHVADIAIMRLKTPLQLTDNYKTVCMPQPRRSYVGARATVTGYGSQSQQFRRAQPKLRQVTVPIWENRKCSVVYKRNMTDSFLCAGYEDGGKDACQGDSGGPLMIDGPSERMMIVGIVSHGIGCGAPGYPGVYTRTTTFMDWIEKNTRE